MTKKQSHQAPILLGKPMRKFTAYSNGQMWKLRVGNLMAVVLRFDDWTPERGAFVQTAWRIEGLRQYELTRYLKRGDPQRAADAAGKVLEGLAKAIRGER